MQIIKDKLSLHIICVQKRVFVLRKKILKIYLSCSLYENNVLSLQSQK